MNLNVQMDSLEMIVSTNAIARIIHLVIQYLEIVFVREDGKDMIAVNPVIKDSMDIVVKKNVLKSMHQTKLVIT